MFLPQNERVNPQPTGEVKADVGALCCAEKAADPKRAVWRGFLPEIHAAGGKGGPARCPGVAGGRSAREGTPRQEDACPAWERDPARPDSLLSGCFQPWGAAGARDVAAACCSPFPGGFRLLGRLQLLPELGSSRRRYSAARRDCRLRLCPSAALPVCSSASRRCQPELQPPLTGLPARFQPTAVAKEKRVSKNPRKFPS